jgi:hypothetical protein
MAIIISHPFAKAEKPTASFRERVGHPEHYREGQKRREAWATRPFKMTENVRLLPGFRIFHPSSQISDQRDFPDLRA